MKILFVITADIYIRNYLRTGALTALVDNHECDLVFSSQISLADEAANHPRFKGFFDHDTVAERAHTLLSDILMWRYRARSRTFLYRWMRNAQWPHFSESEGFRSRVGKVLKWLPGAMANRRGLLVPVLGNRLVFWVTSRILKGKATINPHLTDLFRSEGYDLVVTPSSSYGSTATDIARLGKMHGVATLCLIDNWDNLTSKTVFWARPDFLGVWGPQSVEHAIAIHGFERRQVFSIGTPRFDAYFSDKSPREIESPYLYSYVLFVGSAMPFDEEAAVRRLDRALSEMTNQPAGLKLVYRPHPWRQKARTQVSGLAETLQNTVIDYQSQAALDLHPNGDSGGRFQPDLAYYPALLGGAKVVIGPMTTMLLEATLCGTRVIALAYDDGVHPNTSRKYFVHFDGAERIHGFTFCENPREVGDQLILALEAGGLERAETISSASQFIHKPTPDYGSALLKLAEHAFENCRQAS